MSEPTIGDHFCEPGTKMVIPVRVLYGTCEYNGNTGEPPTVRVAYQAHGGQQNVAIDLLEPPPDLHALHQAFLAFTLSDECVTGSPSWINLDDAVRIVGEWLTGGSA